MSVPIEFTIDRVDFENMRKSAMKIAHEKAARTVLEEFRKQRLYRRFNDSMKSELEYQPRSARWVTRRRKLAKGKPAFDHNFTGATAHAASQARLQIGRSRSTGTYFFRLRIDNLGIQYRRNRANLGRFPDLRSEIMRVSDGEVARAVELYAAEFARVLREDPSVRLKKRRRIG